MKMDIRGFPDIDALNRAALDGLLRIMGDAVRERGRFAIALSGGRTPEKLYRLWADSGAQNARTPWDKVHLFWGDERYVAKDDALSNYRMTREALIARVAIPATNVHRVPGPADAATPQAAATIVSRWRWPSPGCGPRPRSRWTIPTASGHRSRVSRRRCGVSSKREP